MLVNRNGWSRSVVTGSLALLCAPIMICQSRPTSPIRSTLTAQTTPEQAKDLLVETMFTTCSRPGSESPIMFIRVQLLMEYDEAWSKLLPRPLSAAERMDGIQYSGYLVVSGSVHRHFAGGKWSSRENTFITRDVTANSRELHSLGGAFILVRMDKNKDGKWSFGLVGEPGFGTIDPDKFLAKRISCSAAMSDNPER
jgi:hypothetical protein